MRSVATIALLAGACVLLGGAAETENPNAIGILVAGLWLACLVVLAMPTALLLHAWRPEWIARAGRAVEQRKTACVLIGAGLFVVALAVVTAVAKRNAALGVILAIPALAWFVAGFAGCARRQGERLTGMTGAPAASVRPLVLGWLARAGAFAVPVLWPVVGIWLVVTAFGAPAVAMLEKRDRPAA
jgi:hypothetical protein